MGLVPRMLLFLLFISGIILGVATVLCSQWPRVPDAWHDTIRTGILQVSPWGLTKLWVAEGVGK